MDSLTEITAKARAMGLSYGKYVARYGMGAHPVKVEEPKRSFGKGYCWICGAKLTGKRQKYCSAECTRENYLAPRRTCTVCGSLLERTGHRDKYCSKECRLKARAARTREMREQRKEE